MITRALIFDLGNVLVNIDFDRVFQAWASSAGLAVEVIRERFEFDDCYQAHERGSIDGRGYYQHVLKLLAADFSFADFCHGWNEVFVEPTPGIAELLGELSGRLPLYGLTNTNPLHRVAWQARYSKILEPLDKIYVSSDLGCRKPEPAIFEIVDQDIGVGERAAIVFFDDTLTNVLGARRHGWTTFQTRTSGQVRAALEALPGLF